MVTATFPAERAGAIQWETRQFSRPTPPGRVLGRTPAPTVDALLDEARGTYQRISPRAAYQLVLHGRAVIVDIRPEAQRHAEGEVHPDLGPVLIERNVLEWRLDPRSSARLPWVTAETRVLVLCQEGFASSLAAATLVRLGIAATDVIGGLRAWREAGLPLAA
ncbi:MAG TPA: rhodanese-like domain-containing protein [Lapillicoccus sp.]|jgi:rhodanese-related sulfurtransferase|nr:rhodanese-like domain-containing protein [Lapillicoccus sp.]